MKRWIAVFFLVSTLLLLSVGSALAEAASMPGAAGSLPGAPRLFWSGCCDGPGLTALPQSWPDATTLLRKKGNRPGLTDGLPTGDPMLRRRRNAPRLAAPNGQLDGALLLTVDQYTGKTITRGRR
ncbi:MAG: hypothetical protein DYG89_36120 [Caldilinea sp. CFX5]|nr:hypothetical protein [Caldilinea sp. CFX5]